MTKLFESRQAQKARKKAQGLGRHICPLAYWLAADDDAAAERERLNELFAKVPPQHQADVRARLLSKYDEKHIACLFELETWQFLDRRAGWNAEFQPSTSFGTPDVRAVAPDGSEFYVETLTTFEENERATRSRRARYFLAQLDRIKHYFIVNVNSLSVDDAAKPSDFGRFVVAELDALRQRGATDQSELEYQADGAFVVLTVFPTERTDPGPVLLGHGTEIRHLPPTPFKERMRDKAKKYSAVAATGASLLLAVGVTDLAFRGHGVVNSMYGSHQVSFDVDRQTGAQVSDTRQGRDFDAGLLWSNEHGSLAPHLGGAFEIGIGWGPEGDAEIRRPTFGFIHNVWASKRVDAELFADLPQFALPGDEPNSILNDWGRWEDGAAVAVGHRE